MRKSKSVLIGFVLAVFSCLSIVAVAPPKAASAGPYLWDDRKDIGVVPLRGAPTSAANKPTWVVEGTAFSMYCFTDHQNYTGNYTSRRWFWGQALGRTGKIGYVHSSHVKAQVAVPRC